VTARYGFVSDPRDAGSPRRRGQPPATLLGEEGDQPLGWAANTVCASVTSRRAARCPATTHG
jgi:hypothetical protein